MKYELSIEYCPRCRWLMRAAWMAQEFLTSFEEELASVTLIPGNSSGIYAIRINNELVFDRKTNGGFADIAVLKQLVRDRVSPGKNLGHSDRAKNPG
ncbi:MAG: SelT/SelW/SelH family protein [Flavihumibacter sp.]